MQPCGQASEKNASYSCLHFFIGGQFVLSGGSIQSRRLHSCRTAFVAAPAGANPVLVTVVFSMVRSSCGFGQRKQHHRKPTFSIFLSGFILNVSRATKILRLHAAHSQGHEKTATWCSWSCGSIIRFPSGPSVEFLLRTLAIPWKSGLQVFIRGIRFPRPFLV